MYNKKIMHAYAALHMNFWLMFRHYPTNPKIIRNWINSPRLINYTLNKNEHQWTIKLKSKTTDPGKKTATLKDHLDQLNLIKTTYSILFPASSIIPSRLFLLLCCFCFADRDQASPGHRALIFSTFLFINSKFV